MERSRVLTTPGRRQPNILFLITDQHRQDSLGCYGNPVARTPHLDRLAASGACFTSGFTTTAICTPARASLLTGLLPHKHKLLANFERNVGYLTELPAEMVPFSRHLAEAGYRLGHAGKWHIGQEKGPADYGFEGVHYPGWGPPVNHPDYLAYLDARGLPRFSVRDEVRGTFPNGRPANVTMGIYEGPSEGLFDYFIAERTIERLREYARHRHETGQPFFLGCNWFGPHLPYYLPERYYHLYDPADISLPESMKETFAHKPMVQRHYSAHWAFDSFTPDQWRKIMAVKLGYVTLIDEQVGRILAEVDRLGLAEETFVAFTADHGAFTGAHKMQDKGPAMYDDIYRVPFLARLPSSMGGVGGVRDDHLVGHLDLTATFVDLATGSVPAHFDGRSLLPLLRGQSPADWRDDVVAEFHGHHFPYPQRMVRTHHHKLIVNPPDVNELYDLEHDPSELTNQIDNPAYAEVRRDLMNRLYRQLRASGDNFYHWMTTMFEVDVPEHEDTSLSGFRT